MAGIYVHIPFCHSKCAYCDFHSVALPPSRIALAQSMTEAIVREYALRRDELRDDVVRTLYFGGGTPSILPGDLFHRISDVLLGNNPHIEEFTIEVNPEDVTPGNVRMWCHAGVNRVSMGIQSFDDAELRCVSRRHSASAAIRAIDTLRTNGITNISGDLIYGLPGQTPGAWESNLRRLLEMRLPHFSAYCLSYEPGTLLTRKLERGDISEATEDDIIEMYAILCDLARAAGYSHYEISNFCLPGMHSRHNSSYWDNTPYLGLGPSAHSYDGIARRFNPADNAAYLDRPGQPEIEILTESDIFDDLLIIRLRTSGGLDTGRLSPRRYKILMDRARGRIDTGDLVLDSDGILLIPEDRWMLADGIIRDLVD